MKGAQRMNGRDHARIVRVLRLRGGLKISAHIFLPLEGRKRNDTSEQDMRKSHYVAEKFYI